MLRRAKPRASKRKIELPADTCRGKGGPLPVGFELGVQEKWPIRGSGRVEFGLEARSGLGDVRFVLDQPVVGRGRSLCAWHVHRMPCRR